MKIVKEDYNSVDWKSFVEIHPESPSGIRYVGTVKPWGYRQPLKSCGADDSLSGWRLSVNGTRYMVHRIIMLLLDRDLTPYEVVDHLDGNPFNNSIENLRITDSRTNNQNVKKSIRNTSGHTGVFPWKNNKGVVTAYVVTWRNVDKKPKRKFFAFSKYTEEGALELAVEFRKQKIQELIQQGMSYTSRHGL